MQVRGGAKSGQSEGERGWRNRMIGQIVTKIVSEAKAGHFAGLVPVILPLLDGRSSHRNGTTGDPNESAHPVVNRTLRDACGGSLIEFVRRLAAMKSIVRRDTGESYMAYLKRLAEAEGIEAEDAAALLRMDRKRKKKTSNEDWKNPSDEEAEITKLKDGRTALAYKAENAVDMETGAIVAVTTHSGASADTATVKETVIQAGIAVAGLIAEKTPEGKYEVHPEGVQEVVADKGYHSNDVMVGLAEMEVRTYVAEPDRGTRS